MDDTDQRLWRLGGRLIIDLAGSTTGCDPRSARDYHSHLPGSFGLKHKAGLNLYEAKLTVRAARQVGFVSAEFALASKIASSCT
jgi:hypothetical protein